MDTDMDALRSQVVELGEHHGRTVAHEEQHARTPYDPTDSEAAARLHHYAASQALRVIDRLHDKERVNLSLSQQRALVIAYREAFLGGYRDWKQHGNR